MSLEIDNVTVLEHPLAAVKLSVLRDRTTPTDDFRHNMQDLSVLLLAEASRKWATSPVEVETPLRSCVGARLTRPIVLVPILRAGLGMLDGMLRIVPEARVGHLGLYRDEKTLRPVTYYSRLPDVHDAEVLLLDPMLATGQSACAAIALLKAQGAVRLQYVCVVACTAGMRQLQTSHPNVPIITAVIDRELNQVGYIVPGLGDAGDRYFGTGIEPSL